MLKCAISLKKIGLKLSLKHLMILQQKEYAEHIDTRMDLFMMENGEVASEMDKAVKNGQMELIMKVFGKMVEPLEKASLFMLIMMFMKEIG